MMSSRFDANAASAAAIGFSKDCEDGGINMRRRQNLLDRRRVPIVSIGSVARPYQATAGP